jgi:hypothetical protein
MSFGWFLWLVVRQKRVHVQVFVRFSEAGYRSEERVWLSMKSRVCCTVNPSWVEFWKGVICSVGSWRARNVCTLVVTGCNEKGQHGQRYRTVRFNQADSNFPGVVGGPSACDVPGNCARVQLLIRGPEAGSKQTIACWYRGLSDHKPGQSLGGGCRLKVLPLVDVSDKSEWPGESTGQPFLERCT